MRRLVLLSLLLVFIPAPARASTPAKTLGPPPVQADCLSYQSTERGCYYDVGYIDFSLSTHIAHIGQTITGTATHAVDSFPWGWEGAPPGTQRVSCTPANPTNHDTSGSCEYKAVSSSGGFRPGPEASHANADSSVFFGAAIYCCTIGRYTDGDFLAVLGPDEEAISGYTRDKDGKPATSAAVFISGKDDTGKDVDVFASPDPQTGFYDALLAKGTYTVSAAQGTKSMCVASVTTYCRKKSVVSPTTTVDFREDVHARIVGTVTSKQSGKGLPNVALAVKDAIGGLVASAVTGADGSYSVDLDKAALYTVTAAKDGTGLTPASRDVDVKLGDEAHADFQVDSGLTLTLDAPTWHPGDDFATFDLTLKNTGKDKLTDISFAGGEPLTISTAGYPQDPGGLKLLAGPVPALPTSLDPGQEVGATFGVVATAPGRVAAFSKAYAKGAGGERQSDGHTLRITVSADPLNKGVGNQLKMDAAESLAVNAQSALYKSTEKAGQKLYDQGRKALSPAEEKTWFGAADHLKVTPYEAAIARERGVAPELVAASLPNKPVRDNGETFTAEELNAAHDKAFNAKVAQGFKDYAVGAVEGGKSILKGAWSDAVLTGRYMMSSASAEERVQWEATMTSLASNNDSAFGTIGREVADPSTYRYAGQAIGATFDDVTLRTKDLQDQIAQETVLQGNIGKLADADPLAYQKAMAEYDAGWVNTVTPTVMNTILGGVTQRVGGAIFKGPAGALATAEKAAAESGGAGASGPKIPVDGGASGYEVAAVRAEGGIVKTGQTLEEVAKAGGLPTDNIQTIQGHLNTIEGEIADRFGGTPPKLGAAMKPLNGTPKAGAAPKFEILKTKNGTELDLELGMPSEGLAEPVYYDPIDPRTLPTWDATPPVKQNQLLNRYNQMGKEWADFHSDAPTKGTAKVIKAIGKETELELSHGRTALAELERNPIGEKAFTVRAKHYEVRNPGQKKGTVFLDAKEAVPMTYDPDGVAIFDAAKGARLPRQVENYVTTRLRQLVAKDIQAGAASISEHGFTLIMDDAGQLAAGDLVQHGAKFLNERTARTWLERIAPFTGKTAEQMLGENFEGFGQHLTVITSTDAFFGELPITQW